MGLWEDLSPNMPTGFFKASSHLKDYKPLIAFWHLMESVATEGAGHLVHIFSPTCCISTLCQNVIVFHKNIDGNMKFRYCFIIMDHQIYGLMDKFISYKENLVFFYLILMFVGKAGAYPKVEHQS